MALRHIKLVLSNETCYMGGPRIPSYITSFTQFFTFKMNILNLYSLNFDLIVVLASGEVSPQPYFLSSLSIR